MPTEDRNFTPQHSRKTRNRHSEYKGRDRSPFKAHHNGCLCKICKCVVPKRSHRCAPKEASKYPSDLKSVMQEDYIPKSPNNYDYNRDRHMYKPISRPFRSGQKGSDNYQDLNTEYKNNFRGEKAILSKPFIIDHDSHISYPLIDKGSEYDRMTKSVQKGAYIPLSSIETRKSHNVDIGSGKFKGKSLYQDDFKGDQLTREQRSTKRPGCSAFEKTQNLHLNKKFEDKSVYGRDYTPQRARRPINYGMNAYRESRKLPKGEYFEETTTYDDDFKGKQNKEERCIVDQMPHISREVRQRGGHIYFDADYDEWHNSEHGSVNNKYEDEDQNDSEYRLYREKSPKRKNRRLY